MSNTVGVKDPLHGRVSSSFSQRAPGLLISEGTGYITRIQSTTMISIQERCSWMISVLRLSVGVLLQLYPSLQKVFWWNHTLNYESVPSVLLDGLFCLTVSSQCIRLCWLDSDWRWNSGANDASLSCVAAQSTLMGVLRVCVHVSDGI